MTAPPPEVDVIIASLRDATYPISTLAAEAIRHSQNVVANASKDDKTRLQDTPGVESFFWNLWERIFTLAEEDVSTHSRSIAFINAVKTSRVGDTEKRWAARSTPAGWCHLPLLFAVAQDGWDDLHLPLSERERSSSPVQFVLEGGKPERNNRVVTVAAQARTQYLNSQRFIARLLVDAEIDMSFFADRTLRAALKKASGEAHDDTAIVDDSMDEDMDVSMASTSAQASGFTLHDIIDVDAIDSDDESDDEYDPDAAEAESDDEDDADIDDVEISDAPAGLELEAASIWLSIAGKELYKLKETKSKWPSLRRVFTDAANGGGRTPVVIDAAHNALEALSSVDRFNMDAGIQTHDIILHIPKYVGNYLPPVLIFPSIVATQQQFADNANYEYISMFLLAKDSMYSMVFFALSGILQAVVQQSLKSRVSHSFFF
ncbi:hypothetical protein M422DRAFT_255582 [Sphaerobolus stellatus SS14]|uniref:Uncharacterized protein n=1 Tax=Sphaerobolus stellatus (strain SS14) TaxID=990650 RepID=A0A0C9VTG2_SPHS4|nr:hypothetical protein M422DRAFT_255582 [Sphaerobolus stellatus SS14]